MDSASPNQETKHGANKCKNFVLTKKYIDKDEIQEEQGEEIYYDKNYDFTDYAFLKKHNFDVNNELINLYGNFFSSKKKIFSTFFKHLNIFDIFKLLKGYLFIRQKMTVSEWCKFNNLSSKACELLNILTINYRIFG